MNDLLNEEGHLYKTAFVFIFSVVCLSIQSTINRDNLPGNVRSIA